MLSSELSACHESISILKNLNDELNAKLEEVSKTSSWVEHVSICNRCKDFDVDACDEHLIYITKLNDEVASLNALLGNRMLSSYKKNDDPQRAITFGDGNQGLVKGLGKIAISPDHSISNVFLVDSLDYILLQISQLCKIGYNCLFTDIGVTVFRRSDDSVAFKGVLEGQLYLVDFNRAELDTCLIAKTNMGWLWHRRLAHVGMKNLHKLLKGEHILGLTNVHIEKDRVCSACQAGKQVGTHHPHKNIMTTDRPLELLHMDLFGSIA
jgi:hypothetical protein